MSFIATIVNDAAQADGTRHVRYEFADQGVTVYRSKIILSTDDATAIGEALAKHIDAEQAAAEFTQALGQAESGVDPRAIALKFNTQNALFIYMLKRLANADAEGTLPYAQHFDLFTDTEVAALLGQTTSTIAAWRVKLIALRDARDGYSHTLPHYAEVE